VARAIARQLSYGRVLEAVTNPTRESGVEGKMTKGLASVRWTIVVMLGAMRTYCRIS
jgi:hypothetical protein